MEVATAMIPFALRDVGDNNLRGARHDWSEDAALRLHRLLPRSLALRIFAKAGGAPRVSQQSIEKTRVIDGGLCRLATSLPRATPTPPDSVSIDSERLKGGSVKVGDSIPDGAQGTETAGDSLRSKANANL